MPHVLVAGKLHPSGIALLRGALRRDLRLCRGDLRAELRAPDRRRRRACHPDPAALGRRPSEQADRLRIVSRHGVGYDAVDLPSLNDARHRACGLRRRELGLGRRAGDDAAARRREARGPRRPRRARRRLGLAQPPRAGRTLGQAAADRRLRPQRTPRRAHGRGLRHGDPRLRSVPRAPRLARGAGGPGGRPGRGPRLGGLRLGACAEDRQAGDRRGRARGDEAVGRPGEHRPRRRGRRDGADRRACGKGAWRPPASTSSRTSRRRRTTRCFRWIRWCSRRTSPA